MKLSFTRRRRDRENRELRAQAMALGRMIETCQRALAECTPSEPQAGGYIAAQRMRARMLKGELAGYRTELDAVATQIITIESALRSEAQERKTKIVEEADSLDLYTLVQELEDSYGVKMSDEEAARILTVGQAVDFVLAHAPT